MATTIPQAFQVFKSNLEVTDLQAATAATRQQNVREAIESQLEVVDTFLTGSYARNTLIAPLAQADIDIAVVLADKYFHHYNNQNGGQAGLLDVVKRALLRTYTKTPDISRNGQAVTIRFSDFTVDVVPAFNRNGGGYLIPNSVRQEWISTDPKKHVDIMRAANSAQGGQLVPLIKMIKCWNRAHSSYFNSFHLEVLALLALDNVRISDLPSGARYYFDKVRTLVTQKNLDPAGYGGDVGGYINTQQKITDAVSKFQLAYERSLKAEQSAGRGNNYEAIDMWRKNFGDYFPAYG
jgi:predicted nucleotidyltransferase